jgi:polo-like kinase 1
MVSWSYYVIIYLFSYTQLIGKPPFETPEVKTTYKKIKACNYAFPEHVTISDNAKNLISKILVLDPSKRPTL